MGRLGTAFKAFFRVLGDEQVAQQVAKILAAETPAGVGPVPSLATPTPTGEPARETPRPVAIAKPAPMRSDALTLLAVLQREARLVDFLKENIAGYSDDQVGAAVREIHRDSAAVLDRLFALKPVRTEAEGANVTAPAGYDANRIRLVGNVTGQPPHTGSLAHAGWEATKVELPTWNGTEDAVTVVAPAEIELR